MDNKAPRDVDEFWPFPAKLPEPRTNMPVPKFNPNNHEEALI